MQIPAPSTPFFCLLGLLACACDEAPETAPEPAVETAPNNAFLPERGPDAEDCGAAGRLDAQLVGELAGEIHWGSDAVRCEGMPRPNGAGARLRFAGDAGDDQQPLALIIGMPDLRQGEIGSEIASNVTLIEEGRGRFFSTADLETCWSDIVAQTPLDDGGARFSIEGQLYCIGPLAEVNGASSVSIAELRFSGLLDWNAR